MTDVKAVREKEISDVPPVELTPSLSRTFLTCTPRTPRKMYYGGERICQTLASRG
jgi:hypothetical protein